MLLFWGVGVLLLWCGWLLWGVWWGVLVVGFVAVVVFVADFVGKVDFLQGEVRGGRIELTGLTCYNGTFTSSDAQTLAVRILDGVCAALSD